MQDMRLSANGHGKASLGGVCIRTKLQGIEPNPDRVKPRPIPHSTFLRVDDFKALMAQVTSSSSYTVQRQQWLKLRRQRPDDRQARSVLRRFQRGSLDLVIKRTPSTAVDFVKTSANMCLVGVHRAKSVSRAKAS